LVPYFQVAQHNKSILVLNLIKVFLEDSYSGTTQLKDSKNNKAVVNSKDFASNSSTIAINNKNLNNVSIFSNKKTNVSSLVVSNIDTLFYSILPLFDFMLYKSAFFTRKLEDYKL
jgi:alpha-glucuronidase